MATKTTKTIGYEVRFTCYQYNMGSGDLANGTKECVKTFTDAHKALEFADCIKAGVNNHDRKYKDIAENYVHSGFINGYAGVFETVHIEWPISWKHLEGRSGSEPSLSRVSIDTRTLAEVLQDIDDADFDDEYD